MKLYLAHPFDSRHKIRKWELRIEKMTGIELVNPFFDIERPDEGIIYNPKTTREERYAIDETYATVLVERDIEQIKNCDGIIAIVDGSRSYGTIQEMVYAKIMDKHCLAMISNGQSGHPWLRYHSAMIFESLENLERFLIQLEELK